jgi:peptidoglycan/LPS O-acetylase OafA/YrhL
MRGYFSFGRVAGQLPVLDGLRGLAVSLVLLRHASRPFWSVEEPLLPVLGWDAGILLINGWIGVDLFFVLSGFLIAHHILRLRDRHSGPWHWLPYLGKRAFRIVPTYYAVLFLVVLGAFPAYDIPTESMAPRVAYHLLFLQDYLPSNIVVAFWSLGVEEKFYLIAPLLVLARASAGSLRERITGILAILCIGIGLRVLTAIVNSDVDSYAAFFPEFRSPFHMTMDPILMGVVLAFVYRARDARRWWTTASAANFSFLFGASLFVVLAAWRAMMDDITWWDKTLQPTAIALCFSSMTFGLLLGGGPTRIFHSTLLRFLARISYSLYLVHLPLVPLAALLVTVLTGSEPRFGSFILIFILLSIMVATILHFAVEKPFLLIKDRIR